MNFSEFTPESLLLLFFYAAGSVTLVAVSISLMMAFFLRFSKSAVQLRNLRGDFRRLLEELEELSLSKDPSVAFMAITMLTKLTGGLPPANSFSANSESEPQPQPNDYPTAGHGQS